MKTLDGQDVEHIPTIHENWERVRTGLIGISVLLGICCCALGNPNLIPKPDDRPKKLKGGSGGADNARELASRQRIQRERYDAGLSGKKYTT